MDRRIIEIDPNKQYVIICPDKQKALELQKFWISFLAGGVRAIFLYGNIAVVPVEQVVGWTTWDEVGDGRSLTG